MNEKSFEDFIVHGLDFSVDGSSTYKISHTDGFVTQVERIAPGALFPNEVYYDSTGKKLKVLHRDGHVTDISAVNSIVYIPPEAPQLTAEEFESLTQDIYGTNVFGHFWGYPSTEVKCDHSWKEYVGFTNRDWYCTKCSVKTETDPNT